jgi:hypothetical protein
MKRILNSFLFLAAMAVVAVSCVDDTLDPLQFKAVKKGTILALRGTALQNIYKDQKPAAEVFPRIATGTESFAFEAEFLSEDPSALESMDIFVIKKEGSSRTKVLVKNVPFSAFSSDGKYPRPWVAVTLSLKDEILPKLGLANAFPLDASTVSALLSTYSVGINIEIDLNLTDGTKVLASSLVASGLYGSNQFYPAQKLTWAVTDYCFYIENSWAGDFLATETSEFFGAYCGTPAQCTNGGYDVVITKNGASANLFNVDNWYDSGIPIYMSLRPSTDVATQVVTVSKQEFTTGSGKVRLIEGTGTYNQCKGTMAINFTYKDKVSGDVLDAFVWSLKKK